MIIFGEISISIVITLIRGMLVWIVGIILVEFSLFGRAQENMQWQPTSFAMHFQGLWIQTNQFRHNAEKTLFRCSFCGFRTTTTFTSHMQGIFSHFIGYGSSLWIEGQQSMQECRGIRFLFSQGPIQGQTFRPTSTRLVDRHPVLDAP